LDPEHELRAGDNDDAVRTMEARTSAPDSPKVDNEFARLREQLARLQADFENARKRGLKEQQEFRDYALFDTARSSLPVVDNFERSLRTSPPENTPFRTGIELIYKQLLDVLFRIGVRPIHVVGERFNPGIHEAIATVNTDSVEDERIIEELQRGYTFKDRLLRPAMVKVARRIVPYSHH
jgi:molecular chaperone GrpE